MLYATFDKFPFEFFRKVAALGVKLGMVTGEIAAL